MDAIETRKRKRQHIACWECHRRHRSCDGERPCQRCVEKGKAETCQSLQRNPYTRVRKLARGKRLDDRLLSLSIFHQSTDSQSPDSATENIHNEGQDNQKRQLLTELLHQVQQVQERTQSLQQRQALLTEQFSSLRSAPPNDIQNFSSELLDAHASAVSSSEKSPSSIGPSSIKLLDCRTSTDQELFDLWELSHEPEQNLPTTIPNDTKTFRASLFIPFAITDATQPFYVFKIFVKNWDLFVKFPHTEEEFNCKRDPRVCLWTFLSANWPMCELSQYQLEELIGESVFKLVLPIYNAHDPAFMKCHQYMLPQPPSVHVSEVFTRRRKILTKDGTLLTGCSNIQLFYNEGMVSFGVSSVSVVPKRRQKYRRLPSLPSPSPSVQSPDTPSRCSYSTPNSDDSDCWSSPASQPAYKEEEKLPRFSENVWIFDK